MKKAMRRGLVIACGLALLWGGAASAGGVSRDCQINGPTENTPRERDCFFAKRLHKGERWKITKPSYGQPVEIYRGPKDYEARIGYLESGGSIDRRHLHAVDRDGEATILFRAKRKARYAIETMQPF